VPRPVHAAVLTASLSAPSRVSKAGASPACLSDSAAEFLAAAAEALAKLLLHHRVWLRAAAATAGAADAEALADACPSAASGVLRGALSLLLLLNFHPATEAAPKLRQCLSVFFDAFAAAPGGGAAAAREHRRLLAAAALPAARAALGLGGGRAAAAKQPAPSALRFVAQLVAAPAAGAGADADASGAAAAAAEAAAWGAAAFAQQLLTEAEHVWLLLLSQGVQPARNRPYAVALVEVRRGRLHAPGSRGLGPRRSTALDWRLRADWGSSTHSRPRPAPAKHPSITPRRPKRPLPSQKVAAAAPLAPGSPGLGVLVAIAQRLGEQCASDSALSKAVAGLLSRLGPLEAEGAPAPDPEELDEVIGQLRGMCLSLEPRLGPEAAPGCGRSSSGGTVPRVRPSRALAGTAGRRSYVEVEEEDWDGDGEEVEGAAAAGPAAPIAATRRSSRNARASSGVAPEATVEGSQREDGEDGEGEAHADEEFVPAPEAPAWVGRRRGGGAQTLSPAVFDSAAGAHTSSSFDARLAASDLRAASDEEGAYMSDAGSGEGDGDAWHSADERGASRSPEDAPAPPPGPGGRQPFGLSANTNSPVRVVAAGARRAGGGKPVEARKAAVPAAGSGARRVPAARLE
jgi:hypothetical protein